MKIAQKYSHLNGEEYLIVHHNDLYEEIKSVIESIDADDFKTKVSKEKTKKGNMLYSPVDINKEFQKEFSKTNWKESRYSYYITLNRELMEKSILMPTSEQKKFLEDNGEESPIYSYNQTDFVKNKIAVEVQFGKYSFVAYDLFVKHMLFYSGGVINLGIEILPTKNMQSQMSSGIAYFEGEVYNVMRQGRNSPPVPLLILGVEP
ncbi:MULTISPECIES: BglII/BstYI family type II restriction endonuclease [unclassified Leeuwenhoekiella]|uniref:BglII/BstYI family type II restriction endonuclease n=1 Tax=unclassified Leeuwenhoekiella TaxID=2615029 RepID=UPI000C464CFE|nr:MULTISPECIES: BglII/BstYI family type II restriction endonuclease [unclassified Leeuwenhoekiella]MAW95964.1 restriction endonuclease [Leeuwenhoekiella sp.]MBA79958.1 restriction endonuclease [Leeuwenhoekiella sp.]|tara:strand:+ start:5690 stop:6304 length:615 start_codon:yes stop_codon:yes gene_type:complete